MKNLLFSLFLFVAAQVSGQPFLSLSGVVTGDSNKPLPGASVILSPGNGGTVTSDRGTFEFQNIPEGKYTLDVSYVGFQKYSTEIELIEDLNLNIS